MQSIKKKLSENILDKLSMDFLRNQVLKNAYGNDDTFIAKRDPRILLVWYVFFALAPGLWMTCPFCWAASSLWQLPQSWQRWRPWCWSCSVWEYFPRPAISL